MTLGQINRRQSLGNRANLVHLDQDGIGHAQINALLQELDVGDKQIIADQLHALGIELVRQQLPAVPIAFGAAVFNGHNGELLAPALIHGHHLGRRFHGLVALVQRVLAGLGVIEFAGGHIEGNEHILARFVARRANRRHENLQRLRIAVQRGRKTALIAHRGGQLAALENLLQRVEHLGAHPQPFGKRLGAARHNHELLHINWRIGMRAAVDDIHHRHRQHVGIEPAQMPIQRNLQCRRRRARHRHGNAQHGIRAQLGLGLGAIQLQQRVIHRLLLARVHPGQRLGHQRIHIFDRLLHPLAQIALGIAIAQLQRFIRAGGRAGRNRRAAQRAARQLHIGFKGGIPARIKNFTGVDRCNLEHGDSPSFSA